jgi:hypothetical protein
MISRRQFVHDLPLCSVALMAVIPRAKQSATVWTFDRLDRIGGFPVTVLGHPRVINTPFGKAIEFNGVDDAIFIENHPLAGAETFTFEAFFRPDRGGATEQRWFHLSERDPKTGEDTDTRVLFETRLIGDQWCLDAFVNTPKGSQTLLNRDLLHSLDMWFHVAMVYDGRELRSYVNGVLEGKGPLQFSPQGPGHSSVGMRINRMYYFKGAVRQARFTPRVLAPDDLLKLPRRRV